MKKMKLIVGAISLTILLIIFWCAFGGIIKFFWPGQKENAIKVAQEYVEENYKQKMEYLGVQRIFPDTVGYNVYFAPEINADIEFVVRVSTDFTISSDNYYQLYFEHEISKVFEDNIKAIWDSKAYMYTKMNIGPYKKLDIPNLNEKTKLEDIKQYLNEYYFAVQTKRIYDSEDKSAEAERIYMMIKVVQASEYEPDEILFWYLDSKKKEDEFYLSFENWEEITSVGQVEEYLDTKKIE